MKEMELCKEYIEFLGMQANKQRKDKITRVCSEENIWFFR